jgi:hypothetical protein
MATKSQIKNLNGNFKQKIQNMNIRYELIW